jgi:hypothetical protein
MMEVRKKTWKRKATDVKKKKKYFLLCMFECFVKSSIFLVLLCNFTVSNLKREERRVGNE